jgi:hypothetical protein
VGVILGLADPCADFEVVGFGFDDGQLLASVFEHNIGRQAAPTPIGTFDAPRSDGEFTADATLGNHTPARTLQGWLDIFGSGIRFVHELAFPFPDQLTNLLYQLLPFIDISFFDRVIDIRYGISFYR